MDKCKGNQIMVLSCPSFQRTLGAKFHPPEDAFEVPTMTDMMVDPETLDAFLESNPLPDDVVIRPNHYARYEIEPIEFIMINDLPFWLGNVVKYGLRFDAKDGIQDLKKARRYLDMKIKQLEGNKDFAK